ncbi:hypothetical protein EUZ85_16055 [Hahella sp. KA22]|uniref:hypothetical protein n=1 Tax=Hahella sp. KA22 TaxID=1628392 RepID=UPI000FDE92B6|nr:hypothetical protein [Hahella sp. KA22]AZZ92157.1 hypothetical protein ENC22_13490 [Hahella sp. KA22]QAY55528.1 hypothetical protein EUZ85_16055 [Hahella sp. KA22]
MQLVYTLFFSPSQDLNLSRFIGIFTSRIKADQAVADLSHQAPFQGLTDQFVIKECPLDQLAFEPASLLETATPNWSVWRQDDNNNTFFIQGDMTQSEALKLVKDYEDRGHKQMYWAKRDS